MDGAYSFSCALGDLKNDGDLDLAMAVGEAYYNEQTFLWSLRTMALDFSLLWRLKHLDTVLMSPG